MGLDGDAWQLLFVAGGRLLVPFLPSRVLRVLPEYTTWCRSCAVSAAMRTMERCGLTSEALGARGVTMFMRPQGLAWP